jgi:hypothetical protein
MYTCSCRCPRCQPPRLVTWPPVPRSKPNIRPSLLSVHRHGTSLLDLHLTVDHRLRAPHLHTTSQETCRTTQLTSWLGHKLNLGRGSHCQSLITKRTTRAHINLVFAYLYTDLLAHRCLIRGTSVRWYSFSERASTTMHWACRRAPEQSPHRLGRRPRR